MHSDETLDEHFLKMKQLALNGYIEDVALISYIIKDIKDSIMKKSILYSCSSLQEFHSKLKTYEQFFSDDDKRKSI